MSEDRKRVLVTGGTGFIGANLARRLIADGHEVHLLVRPCEARWRLAGTERQSVLHEASVEQQDRVERIVMEVDPQWVFHLAAYGAYSSQRDVQRIVRTNYNGTVNLVEACLRTGFEAFVNAGSSSEYGYKDHAPTEAETVEPNSHYAATKAGATLYCRFVAHKVRRQFTTLRLYSVFGPWEEPTRLIPTLLTRGLHGELPPLVSPKVARDYVYVDDVVDAFVLAAQTSTEDPGVVLNVGTGTQTTIHELVELVRRQLRVDAVPVWGSMPEREWDTDVWVADPTNVTKVTGWKPGVGLEAGLREFVNWIVARPALQRHYETARNPPQ